MSLYSNQVDQDDIVFGIKFSELEGFLYQRYSYLNKLIEIIDFEYDNYISLKKSQPIEAKPEIIKQLEILHNEAKDRLNNDYYVYAILDLLRLFNTNMSSNHDLELLYKDKLSEVIEEIYQNLQEMKIVDLLTDKILYPDYPSSLSYELSKLLPFLSHPINDPLFDYYIKQINNKSNKQIIIYNTDSKDLIFLKIKMMMYYEMWI